jgi:hypothetical protein
LEEAMQAYQSNISHGSSKSFIAGAPYVVSSTEEFAENFISEVVDHIDDLLRDATQELQEKANNNEDWSPYAGLLDVSIDRGTVSYTHRGNGQDDYDMAMLEFGGPDGSPNPLLRMFAIEHAPRMAMDLSRRMTEGVPLA